MIKIILLTMLAFGIQAQGRSVNIAIKKGQDHPTLSNPSGVAVGYDVVCHKADGSGTTLSLTTQTLAVNAKVDLEVAEADSGKCSGGTSPYQTHTDYSGNKFYVCNGSATYANADTLCGIGNTFCMPKSYSNSCTSSINGCGTAPVWVKSDSTTSDFRPDTCTAWGAVTGGNGVVLRHDYTGNGNIVNKSSTNPTSEYFTYAEEQPVGNSYGAVCCADPEYASFCKITITSTSGHLISPSFKNGAAF